MATKKAVKTNIDLEADANQPSANPASLKTILELSNEMRGIESKLALMAEEQARLTERYAQIQLSSLPDAMVAAGMKEFKLITGETINIKDFVRASIPTQSAIEKAEGVDRIALVDRREQCFDWLKKNKADSLIKTELVAEFGKGQGAAAKKLAKLIQKEGYRAKLEENVNFQTLNKFIREQIEAGKEVPADAFALFTGKKAEISKPKKSNQQ